MINADLADTPQQSYNRESENSACYSCARENEVAFDHEGKHEG